MHEEESKSTNGISSSLLLIDFIRSQTNVLNTIAHSTESTERAVTSLANTQEKQNEILIRQEAKQESFRKTTFRLLVGIIIILTAIISSLMVKLNLQGANEISKVVNKLPTNTVDGVDK